MSEENCGICVDTLDWLKKARKAKTAKLAAKSAIEDPPDAYHLGNSTWTFLHTMAAYYPHSPSDSQQEEMHNFFFTLAEFYPCKQCATDFQEKITSYPPQTQSRDDLVKWLCEQHNFVNEKLGKPSFDCRDALRRWRIDEPVSAETRNQNEPSSQGEDSPDTSYKVDLENGLRISDRLKSMLRIK